MAGERRSGRRSGAASRALLLTAARHLFREKGYAAPGTRDIARAAGTTEKLAFRLYGGKAELFDAAARAQIEDFIDTFFASWRARRPDTYSVEQLAREFVSTFIDFADANRMILIDLVGLHGTAAVASQPSASTPFLGLFTKMEELVRDESARLGLTTHNVGRDVRFTFATVISAVLFADVLYCENYPRPARDTIVDHLSDFILIGKLRIRSAPAPPNIRKCNGTVQRECSTSDGVDRRSQGRIATRLRQTEYCCTP